MEIAKQQYWAEVEATVEAICEEAFGAAAEGEDFDTALAESLEEITSDHVWVVYSDHNQDILRHTRNSDALIRKFGEEAVRDKDFWRNWREVQAAFAAQAFLEDVRDALAVRGCGPATLH